MPELAAQERRDGQIGAVPGVIQGHCRPHERHHADGHFQIVEQCPGFQCTAFQIQRIVGTRTAAMGFQQPTHVHVQ